MEELNKSFKNHTDKRIREMHERARKIKAEKTKEKMKKIAEIQTKKRQRRKK
jgi:hypothetical protein